MNIEQVRQVYRIAEVIRQRDSLANALSKVLHVYGKCFSESDRVILVDADKARAEKGAE